MSSSPPKDLLTCTVTRRLNHLEFNLKSAQIEEAMRLISAGRTREGRDGNIWTDANGRGVNYYAVEMGANGIPIALPGFTGGHFGLWGSRELILTRPAATINLSMLLAVGLGAGVTVRVATVISEKNLDSFLESFKSAIRQFYIDFLRDSTRHIRLTTEEITA